jgi:predicted DNA-binding transcriptional regulator AlpA
MSLYIYLKGKTMEEFNGILQMLKDSFPKKMTLNKKEVSGVMGISLSTLDNYIARGYKLPKYIKMGNSKNSVVRFNIVDVAKFLANAQVKVYE